MAVVTDRRRHPAGGGDAARRRIARSWMAALGTAVALLAATSSEARTPIPIPVIPSRLTTLQIVEGASVDGVLVCDDDTLAVKRPTGVTLRSGGVARTPVTHSLLCSSVAKLVVDQVEGRQEAAGCRAGTGLQICRVEGLPQFISPSGDIYVTKPQDAAANRRVRVLPDAQRALLRDGAVLIQGKSAQIRVCPLAKPACDVRLNLNQPGELYDARLSRGAVYLALSQNNGLDIFECSLRTRACRFLWDVALNSLKADYFNHHDFSSPAISAGARDFRPGGQVWVLPGRRLVVAGGSCAKSTCVALLKINGGN